jgi:hypothetical protein
MQFDQLKRREFIAALTTGTSPARTSLWQRRAGDEGHKRNSGHEKQADHKREEIVPSQNELVASPPADVWCELKHSDAPSS